MTNFSHSLKTEVNKYYKKVAPSLLLCDLKIFHLWVSKVFALQYRIDNEKNTCPC